MNQDDQSSIITPTIELDTSSSATKLEDIELAERLLLLKNCVGSVAAMGSATSCSIDQIQNDNTNDVEHTESIKSMPSKSLERSAKRKMVTFEEMVRLMDMYGPIKSARQRKGSEAEIVLKADSLKRKFYRWFPDFDTRFEQMPNGLHEPKAGHEQEVLYRQSLRDWDMRVLVSKRKAFRVSRSLKKKH